MDTTFAALSAEAQVMQTEARAQVHLQQPESWRSSNSHTNSTSTTSSVTSIEDTVFQSHHSQKAASTEKKHSGSFPPASLTKTSKPTTHRRLAVRPHSPLHNTPRSPSTVKSVRSSFDETLAAKTIDPLTAKAQYIFDAYSARHSQQRPAEWQHYKSEIRKGRRLVLAESGRLQCLPAEEESCWEEELVEREDYGLET